MMIFPIILTIIFSIFSTAILSYISMAVMIGPWIHSLIIIACSIIFSIFASRISAESRTKSISLITAGSSIGGILATGCGFAFPTLYFLNKDLFNQWLATPWYFIAIMAVLAFSAGALGLLIANAFEHKLLTVDKLPFPIGELNYNLITLQNNRSEIYQLLIGSTLSGIYSFVAGICCTAQRFVFFNSVKLGRIAIPAFGIPTMEFPLLLSIGFIAGNILLMPLTVGLISKIFLLNPVHEQFFDYLKYNDFSFAFISGMVFYGALTSLLELPKFFKGIIKKLKNSTGFSGNSFVNSGKYDYIEWLLIGALIVLLLSWFKFGIPFQIYLILFTALCTYQLLIIGGEMGMAPVARFATFVMMPALFIFNTNNEQLTIISTFVEVCGGVAVDVLFGRKLAQLCGLEQKQVRSFQWFGLLISSLSVGVIFLILINKFGLGSAHLIAQRGQTRALTIQFQSFDFYTIILGALYGSLLKEFKVNPIMVLGGILMPIEWVFTLMIGGGIAAVVANPKNYQVFWSGVFAVNSIVMIIKALI